MNVRAPQPHPAQPPPAPIAARRDATTPLQPPPATTAAGGECKRILGQQDPVPHQGGLHLLYEPTAEDKWISRQIATCEEGGYKDAQTGKPQQRRRGKLRALPAALLRTLQSGEQADRLVQIVDRYMPRTADENRACVMHYPDKVGEMLRCSKRPGSFARRFERGKVGGRYFRSSKAWRTAARKSPTQCRRTCDDERSS